MNANIEALIVVVLLWGGVFCWATALWMHSKIHELRMKYKYGDRQ